MFSFFAARRNLMCSFRPVRLLLSGLLVGLSMSRAYPAELMVARWRTFTHRDWQSPRVPVVALHEDRQGRLWAGTAGAGVLCYDGLRWRRFTPSNSKLSYPGVLCMAETADGTLWFGTGLPGGQEGAGLCAFTPKGQWLHFDRILSDRKLGAVTALWPSREGKLWVGTRQNGIFTYDLRSHQWALRETLVAGEAAVWSVTALAESPDGIWVATTGPARLFLPANSRWQTFKRLEAISAMEVDREGRLWLAGRYGELYMQAPGQSRPRRQNMPLPTAIAEGEAGFLGLHMDRTGRLWVASERGAAVYDLSRRSWQAWWTTSNSSLPSDRVFAILEKRDGTLWFGTDRGIGVCDFRPGGWQRFVKGQGILLNENVSAICRRQDGTLLFAGDRGVDTYDPKLNRWQSFLPDVPGWNASIHHIAQTPDGTTWFVSPFQLFSWKGGKWSAYWVGPAGLAEAGRPDVVRQSLGVAWAGTVAGKLWLGSQTGGLFEYDPRSRDWERLPLSDAREMVSAFLLDAHQGRDGSWWLAVLLPGATRAILHYLPSGNQWQAFTRKSIGLSRSPGTPDEGAPTAPIHEASDGSLWFGSRGGLLRYRGRPWQFYPLPPGPGEEEMGEVRAIASDPEGHIWVGTGRGVAVLQGGHVQWLSEEDGLAGDETRAILTADSSVWIASDGGISRYRPDSILPETFLLTGRGEVLSRNASGQQCYQDDAFGSGTLPVILNRMPLWPRKRGGMPPIRVEETFSLSALAANPWYAEGPEGFWFSWQTDDGLWTPETKASMHTFRNLRPGLHTIRVRARNRWLCADPSPAECRVLVPTSTGQGRVWLLAVLNLIGWGLAFYLWRLRKR